ncbi:MAG: hypothetical protein DRN40_04760 [Thermoplasmata archaeon]|nr:MAG: hypothetical protein DRN40_04760 [Thermoplasmata archaeon]
MPADVREVKKAGRGGGLVVSKKDVLGEYLEIMLVRSLRPRGGAVTALISAALTAGEIDGAVVVKADDLWRPKAVIATSEEEILSAAGSKWVITPMVRAILDALRSRRLEKIAVIGTPCQAQALRDMKEYPLQTGELASRIKLIVGLFCMGSFTQDGFRTMVETKYGIRLPEIKEAEVKEEFFSLTLKDGRQINIPLEEFHGGIQVACLSCNDFTARSSDISAGRHGAEEMGERIFIIRSEEGRKILQTAEEMGYLKSGEATEKNVEEIFKEGVAKWRRAERFTEQLPF